MSMIPLSKSQIRADDYRDKARTSAALADASLLDHVREKHARAAATWTGLADFEERPRPAPARS